MVDSLDAKLSDDEITILLIAVQGQSMAAIGRWEKPLYKLQELGLMTHDKFNSQITNSGRAAVDRYETETDAALKQTTVSSKVKLEAVVQRVAKEIAEFAVGEHSIATRAEIEQFAFRIIMRTLVLPS